MPGHAPDRHILPGSLTPDLALRRLRARGVAGLVLLESLGPLTPDARYSLLGAAPARTQTTLPDLPTPDGSFFPAWLGGLKYEAAQAFGLPTRPPNSPAQVWGWYRSGVVWDRQTGEVWAEGEGARGWAAWLAPHPGEDALPQLRVGPLGNDDLDFAAGVAAIQSLIRAGEVYQVNLSRGVRASAEGDPLAAYLSLRQHNPSPFMAYAELGSEVVVSGSPERLVQLHGGAVSARPIAGTRRRGATPAEDERLEAELRADPKEQAEHVMLVDLIRHDLGWLARPGTVQVPDLGLVERYSHVMHLVSAVTAQARPGLSSHETVQATFPGGTITGAPKRRVMQAIAKLEPEPRGWYTGSLGVLNGRGLDLNILIRTASFSPAGAGPVAAGQAGRWQVQVRAGAGVVIDSLPARETQETVDKAQALLNVLGGQSRPAAPPALPRPGRPWAPPRAPAAPPLRVLLLDNFDSFTQNLAHDLAALGAQVTLRDHHTPLTELLALRPQAVLTGPGPGTPDSSGVTLALTRAGLDLGLPLLGVCLGHQALAQVRGGTVARAVSAVHGQAWAVQHDGAGLFAGLPPGAVFGRYHSLLTGEGDYRVTARTVTGEVMALEVPGRPAWGVQFHPESVLSPHGRALLANWLRLAAGWTA